MTPSIAPVRVRIRYRRPEQHYTDTRALNRVRHPDWERIQLRGRLGDVIQILRQLRDQFTPTPF